MKKSLKRYSVFTVFVFTMFIILNHANAQTDSTGLNRMGNSNRNQYNNSTMPDSGMNRPNPNAETMQNPNNDNSMEGVKSHSEMHNGDSMHRQQMGMKDSTESFHKQHMSMQDSMHAVKPVQPVKPVAPSKLTQPVKPPHPVKPPNKNKVKTTKNKTMYLVPDSLNRKNTLK